MTEKQKHFAQLATLGVYFILLFFAAVSHTIDYDLWFHIKSGEVFLQKGILFSDVFSHSALGREWIPHEWLFEIIVYLVQKFISFDAIKYFLAIFASLQALMIYLIARKVISLGFSSSILVSLFYFVSTYEFFTQRPHIVAYFLLFLNLFFVLLYYLKDKNLLLFTLPTTLIWANLHSSIFLNAYVFLFFTLLTFAQIKKDKSQKNKFLTLLKFTIANFLLTILPPLGFADYKYLFNFFQNRSFISSFIDEWVPLQYNKFSFIIFTLTAVSIIASLGFTIYKKKLLSKYIFLLFLLPLLLLPYLASRNIVLGYLSLSLGLGFLIQIANIKKNYLNAFLAIMAIVHLLILFDKTKPFTIYYPEKATQFIKNYNLEGNMFNEYGYGGYLLYHLYPNQKVFIDGRTDIYLCCEMRDLTQLGIYKNADDEKFKNILTDLFNKYKISFALLGTEKHTVLRRVSRILTDDSNWILIFWDDYSQIFVKKDSKNQKLIEQFGTMAATPYNRNPFKADAKETALKEYQRMIEIADSSKSRNAIGYIYLTDKKIEDAKIEFDKAIRLNPNNESPYMNLAEIAVLNDLIPGAIALYTKALELAPDRGFIYIRLGQLYIKQNNNINKAKKIWQEGLTKTIDDDAKLKLQELLNN